MRTFSRPTLLTNSAACPVVYSRYGPFSTVLTASTMTVTFAASASPAAKRTFSRASASCSSRSMPGISCPTSTFIFLHSNDRARSSATGTFSLNCSSRSGSPTSPLSPAGISPASKLKSATSRSASFTARSISLRSASWPGHQNSTAEKPAEAARPKRSSSGTSLNRIETFALNLMPTLLLLLPAYPKAGDRLTDGYNARMRNDLQEILSTVVAAGKAAGAMARAAEEVFGDRISGGLVITKDDHDSGPESFETVFASHPEPDERSVE